jgi:hypothetical protein
MVMLPYTVCRDNCHEYGHSSVTHFLFSWTLPLAPALPLLGAGANTIHRYYRYWKYNAIATGAP